MRSPKKLNCVCAGDVPLLTSVKVVLQFSSAAMCGIDPTKLGPVGAPIVRLKARVPLADVASVTLAVKLKVPCAVGVPVIVPEPDSDNPGTAPDANDQT